MSTLYDHILQFANEAEARAALPEWYVEIDRGTVEDPQPTGEYMWAPPQNEFGSGIIETRVMIQAQWDYSDPDNPVQTRPESVWPGYHLLIARSEVQPDWDSPWQNNALRVIKDRNLPSNDLDSYVYLAPDFDEEWFSGDYSINPHFAQTLPEAAIPLPQVNLTIPPGYAQLLKSLKELIDLFKLHLKEHT